MTSGSSAQFSAFAPVSNASGAALLSTSALFSFGDFFSLLFFYRWPSDQRAGEFLHLRRVHRLGIFVGGLGAGILRLRISLGLLGLFFPGLGGLAHHRHRFWFVLDLQIFSGFRFHDFSFFAGAGGAMAKGPLAGWSAPSVITETAAYGVSKPSSAMTSTVPSLWTFVTTQTDSAFGYDRLNGATKGRESPAFIACSSLFCRRFAPSSGRRSACPERWSLCR